MNFELDTLMCDDLVLKTYLVIRNIIRVLALEKKPSCNNPCLQSRICLKSWACNTAKATVH